MPWELLAFSIHVLEKKSQIDQCAVEILDLAFVISSAACQLLQTIFDGLAGATNFDERFPLVHLENSDKIQLMPFWIRSGRTRARLYVICESHGLLSLEATTVGIADLRQYTASGKQQQYGRVCISTAITSALTTG